MSEVEKKRAFNKLKHDLEPWRNVFTYLDSFLKWEKPYYPAVLFGIITTLYLVFWLLDFSVITMLALLLLVFTVAEFAYPSLANTLFKSENWNTQQEIQFERILEDIVIIKSNFTGFYEYFFSGQKSIKFQIAISLVLLLIAYIGAVFNNLFIMYILTMATVMYPGMHERKLFDVLKTKVQSILKIYQNVDKKTE